MAISCRSSSSCASCASCFRLLPWPPRCIARPRRAALARVTRSDLLEPVPVLVDRGEAPAVFAAELELLAQPADVGVDGPGGDRRAEVPDILEQIGRASCRRECGSGRYELELTE